MCVLEYLYWWAFFKVAPMFGCRCWCSFLLPAIAICSVMFFFCMLFEFMIDVHYGFIGQLMWQLEQLQQSLSSVLCSSVECLILYTTSRWNRQHWRLASWLWGDSQRLWPVPLLSLGRHTALLSVALGPRLDGRMVIWVCFTGGSDVLSSVIVLSVLGVNAGSQMCTGVEFQWAAECPNQWSPIQFALFNVYIIYSK